MTVVGFVGLGTMGGPMAANVARAGYDLRVYDTDAELTGRVAGEIGATATDQQGLAECSIVVTMLPTSAIVRSVLLTEDGAPRIPFAEGTVIVDMSSSDPTETVETGAALSKHGVTLVDAPVSGARPRAVEATLAIMLGADDDAAAERAIPVIDTMSGHIFRTGKLGTGHAMKALNNFVAGAAFAACSEALIAGERFGLDPQVMVDVMDVSTGQSFMTSHVLGPHVVDKQFATGFALPLITKDIKIAQNLERAVGHASPVCDAVTSAFEGALDELGTVDHTRAYQHWENS